MSLLSYVQLDMSQLQLKEPDLTALKLLFQALSSEGRVRILNLLRKSPKNVGEIMEALDLEQTVVSHNLRCLALCGLVTVQQNGKNREYSVNRDTIEPLFTAGTRHITLYAANLRECETLER